MACVDEAATVDPLQEAEHAPRAPEAHRREYKRRRQRTHHGLRTGVTNLAVREVELEVCEGPGRDQQSESCGSKAARW